MKHVPPVNDNDQSQVSAVLSNEEVIFSSSFKRHNQTWMKCCITQPIPEGNRLLSRFLTWKMAFPGGTSGKEPTCQCRRPKRRSFDTWVGKIPWRRAWNPLQYSCRENPMNRGAWRATVHRVTKSWTWWNQLSMCGQSWKIQLNQHSLLYRARQLRCVQRTR